MSEPRKTCYGVLHLAPLPGTPFYETGSLRQTIADAVESARALAAGGAHGALLQTADRVYSVEDDCDPARLAAMAVLTEAVVAAVPADFAVGVQIMRHALRASLAVAKVCGARFIRADTVIGETLTPQGRVAADPVKVMGYRYSIDAADVAVLADIHSMHFTWPDDRRTIAQVAGSAQQSGADAVCIGDPDDSKTIALLQEVRRTQPRIRRFLAGHANHDNVAALLPNAEGVFVASCINDGGWAGHVSAEKVKSFMEIVDEVARTS